jgi:hypothetical protein
VPVRVFIDTDPGFTQANHLLKPADRELAARHTAFFTFAENVGTTARLPDDGLPWVATRQPIVRDLWPIVPPRATGAFTTVMLWDSYPPIEVGSVSLGLKSDSFAPYVDLPARVGAPLELALGGAGAPREMLRDRGWSILDSRVPTRSVESYRTYIANSFAEFSVAKQGYVLTHSGWFSERTANYMATGRPVISQDTGFSDVLPTGEGLLAFSEPVEAVAAIEEVRAHHVRHCRAAADIAAAFFDSSLVLARLLEKSFASSSTVREK